MYDMMAMAFFSTCLEPTCVRVHVWHMDTRTFISTYALDSCVLFARLRGPQVRGVGRFLRFDLSGHDCTTRMSRALRGAAIYEPWWQKCDGRLRTTEC